MPVDPRPLNQAEKAVLEHILSVDFEGAARLRAQLDHAEVVALWSRESVSIDLRVPGFAPRWSLPGALVPVDARVLDERGEYIGELLVWVEAGGALAGLEYAWVTDQMPTALPHVNRIRLTSHA